jgi:hypothetical protein
MFDVKFNLKSLPLPFTHITFLKRYPLKDVLPSKLSASFATKKIGASFAPE